MRIIKKHDFGDVTGYELGFSHIGRPLMNVIFYLSDTILIDTGQSNMNRYCIEIVKDKKISKVLLTHHHEDHSGNASLIKKAKNVPIFAHPIALDKLSNGFKIKPFQRYVWGKAGLVNADALPEKIESDNVSFEPVHTPGHSRDHVVFYEKNRGWLFSGDLFLGRYIKYFRSDENIYETITSLKKVMSFDFDSLYCAHNPQTKDGKRYIGEKLGFLEGFCGEIKKIHDKGYNETEIINLLRDREARFIKIVTFGNASFANMVRSAIRDTDSLR